MADLDSPIRTAGDAVEVIDPRNKLCGKCGVVQFFVGDNIYVKFTGLRWAPTRMFFPDQLRLSSAPQDERARASSGQRRPRIALHKRGV